MKKSCVVRFFSFDIQLLAYLEGLKKFLLVAIMLCAVLCLKSNVSAEEKNNSLKIKVVSDGKEYCYDDYNSYYNLSELDTVSYDSVNCILTLNNFIGEREATQTNSSNHLCFISRSNLS